MIAWHDDRDRALVDQLAADLGGEAFTSHTGLPVRPQWSLTKHRWLNEHHPDARRAVPAGHSRVGRRRAWRRAGKRVLARVAYRLAESDNRGLVAAGPGLVGAAARAAAPARPRRGAAGVRERGVGAPAPSRGCAHRGRPRPPRRCGRGRGRSGW